MTHAPSEGPDEVPHHEIREFMAEVRGTPYIAYHSLEQARADPDATVVLSGDHGVIVYLTVPVRLLGCDVATLRTLVSDLDVVTWMSGDLTIATVALERHPVGAVIDGGGTVVEGVWVHPTVLAAELRGQAVDVVLGRRARVDVTVLRRLRERELGRKKKWRTANPSRYDLAWDFDIRPPAIPFE